MEIVKAGKNTKFESTCPECEAQFTFYKAEVNTDEESIGMFYQGKTAHPAFLKYNYIDCPCCGKRLFLGKGMIIPAEQKKAFSSFYKKETPFTLCNKKVSE